MGHPRGLQLLVSSRTGLTTTEHAPSGAVDASGTGAAGQAVLSLVPYTSWRLPREQPARNGSGIEVLVRSSERLSRVTSSSIRDQATYAVAPRTKTLLGYRQGPLHSPPAAAL